MENKKHNRNVAIDDLASEKLSARQLKSITQVEISEQIGPDLDIHISPKKFHICFNLTLSTPKFLGVIGVGLLIYQLLEILTPFLSAHFSNGPP